MKLKKNIFFYSIIAVFLLVQIPNILLAQPNKNNSDKEIIKIYNKSKLYYPKNDELINGCEYKSPSKKIKGNPFFNNYKWNEGILYINNSKYAELLLKYDLISDEFILNTQIFEGVEKKIILNKFQIDSLLFNNITFINIPTEKKHTYFELIFDGNISFLRKYRKRFIKIYNDSSPVGKFSKLYEDLFIFDKKSKKIIKVNNLFSFLNFFEKKDRKQIKKYIKDNKIEYKIISNKQIIDLMLFASSSIIK